MNNWQYHDSKMKELKKLYNKTSKQTQNRMQELINTFNFEFTTLYNIADNKTKNKINTYIEEWKDKGFLTGYFGMLANNIYKRTRVKNNEILELLIYGTYIEEQNKLKEPELNIMYDDVNYYYQQGQAEVNPKKTSSVLKWALFLALLEQTNAQGYVYKQYVESIIKYNADQIYRQAIIDLQQEKQPDIMNDIYQNLINRQNNSKLNINKNKISGNVDTQLIGMNNLAKLEGIKELEKNARVRFAAVIDGKETDMCYSLNGQIFYINKENEFYRYYGETQKELRMQKIKCKGLVLGLNLPPISHHFHWCRSYIVYLPVENQEEIEYNINNYLRTELYNNKDYSNYINDYEKVRNEYEKLPINVKRRLFEKEKLKVVFNYEKEHSGYNYKTKEILLKPNLEDGEFIHEIGHALEYILDLRKNQKYIEISNKLFDNNYKEAKFDKEEIYYGLADTSNFISSYQSYLGIEYDEIIKNYNNKYLRELISECYRDIYSSSSTLENINKELYDLIKEIEKNA